MNSREIIRILEKAGWTHVRTTGSHHHFRHATKPGTVTVPYSKRELPIGTFRSILKQAGIDPKDIK